MADIKEPENFEHQRESVVNNGAEVSRKGTNGLREN